MSNSLLNYFKKTENKATPVKDNSPASHSPAAANKTPLAANRISEQLSVNNNKENSASPLGTPSSRSLAKSEKKENVTPKTLKATPQQSNKTNRMECDDGNNDDDNDDDDEIIRPVGRINPYLQPTRRKRNFLIYYFCKHRKRTRLIRRSRSSANES